MTAQDKYQAEVAQAKKLKKPTANIPKPGQQPPKPAAMCPPSAAFGILASALPPGPRDGSTGAAGPRDAVKSR